MQLSTACCRFKYTHNFLQWALQPPGFKPEWHIGVRVKGNSKLVGFITGTSRSVCANLTPYAVVQPLGATSRVSRLGLIFAPCLPLLSPVLLSKGLFNACSGACNNLHKGNHQGHGGDQLPLRAQEAAQQATHTSAHQGTSALQLLCCTGLLPTAQEDTTLSLIAACQPMTSVHRHARLVSVQLCNSMPLP